LTSRHRRFAHSTAKLNPKVGRREWRSRALRYDQPIARRFDSANTEKSWIGGGTSREFSPSPISQRDGRSTLNRDKNHSVGGARSGEHRNMPTATVKGFDELKREMTRLNVAVARRLSANAAPSGARVGRGQAQLLPIPAVVIGIWLRTLSSYRLAGSITPDSRAGFDRFRPQSRPVIGGFERLVVTQLGHSGLDGRGGHRKTLFRRARRFPP
jgi:hypothetical protein